MRKWEKAMIEYSRTGTVKECPYCKAAGVKVTEHEHGERKSFTFSCAKCGKEIHIN